MAERILDIHALSPLLWRDGRPFAGAEGNETSARSLPLPLPSTIAGFVRTQVGRAKNSDWNHEYLKDLHGMQVCSPLLARSNQSVLPAPRDAVVYKEGETVRVMRLKPRELGSGEGCNLPDGLQPLEVSQDFKPESGYELWTQTDMTQWLLGNSAPPDKIESLPLDTRVHVAMDSEKGKGKEGHLYSVAYRTLETLDNQQHHPWSIRARVSLDTLPERIGRLGGEGRPATISVLDGLSQHWFDCPAQIKTAFAGLGVGSLVRMVLATPALFAHGWKPGWVEKSGSGEVHLPRGLSKVRLKLVSVAVGRREAVSGWNLRTNQPKAVRWMAPAGSVYFFEIVEGDPSALLESWLRPVSDIEQDRKDGFGLALWGVC